MTELYIEEIEGDGGSIVMLAALTAPPGVVPPRIKSWVIRHLSPAACEMLRDSLDVAVDCGDVESTLDMWTLLQEEA